MIADALSAELAKLRANRSALVLGMGVVPAFTLLFAAVGQLAALSGNPALSILARAPLLAEATGALRAAGNPMCHIFFVAAAAVLFAGEYRWETWRFIVPRNRRRNLIAAKFLAYAVMSAGALVLIMLAETLMALIGGIAAGAALELGINPGALLTLALTFVFSLVQLCALGAVAAVLAVASRSVLAVVLSVFMFSFWQTIAFIVEDSLQTDPRFIAALPNLAGDTARLWAVQLGGAGDLGAAATHGPLAVAALIAWTVAGLGAAIHLFGRQDLSQE